MSERQYWLGFSLFPGIGPKKYSLLLERFETAKNAWEADHKLLQTVIGNVLASQFVTFRETYNPQIIVDTLEKKQISFVTLTDKEYPQLLKHISNPPFVLYVKGNLYNSSSSEALAKSRSKSSRQARTENTIAIVGTRRITEYGREVTEQITEKLVASGFVIVSGLAYGVDAVAHATTVINNGKTIAVLGCGVDCCYPRSNKKIYDDIIRTGGAIVSEFPPGMQPSVGSFPSRNRIIAGLSEAVIVTEGAADSGALYTANDAFAIGRPVFAVPGPITSSLSKGPHSLIEKGAKIIMSGDDILNILGTEGTKEPKETKETRGDTEEEQEIIDLLQSEHLHVDEIGKKLHKDSAALGVLLSIMEMKGMIKSDGGLFRIAY